MANDLSVAKQIQSISKDIEDSLSRIDTLMRENYPDKREIFYQHILPQIITALHQQSRWLPRGRYSLEYLVQSILNEDTKSSGIKSYLENK